MNKTPTEVSIDDLDEIPTLSFRRICAKKDCKRDARAGGGKLCRRHHAEATAIWRRETAKRVQKAPKTPRPPVTSSSAAEVRRRVALSRALKRETMARGECARGMGHEQAIAVFSTPANPAATGAELFAGLLWLCRPCRHEHLTEADRAAQAERERVAERAAQAERASTIATGTTAFASLPPDIQIAISAQAASGPRGLKLRPESPLYQQRLAKLVVDYLSQRPAEPPSSHHI